MPASARAATAFPDCQHAMDSGLRRLWLRWSPSSDLPWTGHRPWVLAASIGIAAMTPWPLAAAVLLALMGLRREHQLRRRLQELALLGQFNRLADTHSGADVALEQVLPATRAFFQARHCRLVLTEPSRPIDPRPAAGEHQVCVPLALPAGPAQLQLHSLGPIHTRNAAFLAEVAEQIEALIHRCNQTERMVQEATRRVRHRVALDLHDSAIQPYIGLKLAVEALCMQAKADHPLEAGLSQISAMAARVIEDLQGCRRQISDPQVWSPPLALVAEIKHQAQLMQQFHGVHISVKALDEPPVSEHLRTEVMHMVREGLSNIRRHTRARTGEVQLECNGAWLALRIANEGPPEACRFTPRSISERASALGGRVQVCHETHGQTAVRIEIPVDRLAAS